MSEFTPLREAVDTIANRAPSPDFDELKRRATRRGRRRIAMVAAAAAATVLGVSAITVSGQQGDGSAPAGPGPTVNVGFALPIEYPVGEKLPDLGDTPGPLAAVWVARREGHAPEFVGLVAETGRFGTIPIEVPDWDNPAPEYWPNAELSPDGRRIAFHLSPAEGLVVRDLVSGEESFWDYELGVRSVTGWIDADHLFGMVTPGSSAEGWLWELGTAPERVYWYGMPYGDSGLSVPLNGGGPRSCSPPIVQDLEFSETNGRDWAGSFSVPVLCDIEGVTESGMVLGHWKDQRDGNGTVVALDVVAADPPHGTAATGPANPGSAVFDGPALRHVVVTAGTRDQVTFAANLIEEALNAVGGAS
jgi:hypothetical protein